MKVTRVIFRFLNSDSREFRSNYFCLKAMVLKLNIPFLINCTNRSLKVCFLIKHMSHRTKGGGGGVMRESEKCQKMSRII